MIVDTGLKKKGTYTTINVLLSLHAGLGGLHLNSYQIKMLLSLYQHKLSIRENASFQNGQYWDILGRGNEYIGKNAKNMTIHGFLSSCVNMKIGNGHLIYGNFYNTTKVNSTFFFAVKWYLHVRWFY